MMGSKDSGWPVGVVVLAALFSWGCPDSGEIGFHPDTNTNPRGTDVGQEDAGIADTGQPDLPSDVQAELVPDLPLADGMLCHPGTAKCVGTNYLVCRPDGLDWILTDCEVACTSHGCVGEANDVVEPVDDVPGVEDVTPPQDPGTADPGPQDDGPSDTPVQPPSKCPWECKAKNGEPAYWCDKYNWPFSTPDSIHNFNFNCPPDHVCCQPLNATDPWAVADYCNDGPGECSTFCQGGETQLLDHYCYNASSMCCAP